MIAAGLGLSLRCPPLHPALCARRTELGSSALTGTRLVGDGKGDSRKVRRSSVALRPIMAMEEHQVWVGRVEESVAAGGGVQGLQDRQLGPVVSPVVGECDCATDGAADAAATGVDHPVLSTVGKSTNILWHDCPVGKLERQKLLGQRGCVIWITGLSGSGKSTLACALSRELYCRGYLSYVLDGDNVRHGLNKDLSFKPEDRAENIRRIGEVAKLFADAGVICIASLISPYRRDRDACRALLPEPNFIEVFMDMPLEVCEARDPKGLYKLARAGKIKGFTGIDDPYECPLNCEIAIQQKDGLCPSPIAMVEQVMLYLELNGYLQAEFDL